MATIYLATVGKQGLVRVGELSTAKAHYAAERLAAVPGVSLRFAQHSSRSSRSGCRSPRAGGGQARPAEHPGRAAAQDARPQALDCLLVAVTERRTKDEIDAFADALAKAVA